MICTSFRLVSGLAFACAIASCAPVEGSSEFVSDAPPAKVVGEPVTCLSITSIRQSNVHDDRTIDFVTRGGKVYRNSLSRGCSRLGFEESFTYATSIARLCRNEIIYTLESGGGNNLQRGAGCSLNDFVPIEYIEDEED
ncbi:MAG: hypothetical protein ABJP48_06920 [Erythrobacter sp.]